MSHKRTRNRPNEFTLDRQHPLARGLVFAGLGRVVGSTHYRDSSPYGNHGTLTGMVPAEDWVFDPTLGRFGTYNSTYGSAKYINVPGVPVLSYIKGFTLACWIRPFSLTNNSYYGDFYTDRLSQICGWQDGYYNFYNAGYPFSNNSALSKMPMSGVGIWDHVVWSMNPSYVLNGHVNGARIVSGDTGSLQSSGPGLRIGSSYTTTSNTAFATILDYCVWQRCLSQLEIQQLADPSNVMLSGLILPPRRRFWAVGAAAPPATNRRRRMLLAGVPR